MTIDKLLEKHAKHFVPETEGRKALQGIHYHENGSIYVTDSHKLLAVNNAHDRKPCTEHYKTGEIMDVNYPEDVSKLLDREYDNSITLNMKDVKPYIPLLKVASNISNVADLMVGNGELKLQVEDDWASSGSFQLKLANLKNDHHMHVISLDIAYFYHILQFFKDAETDKIIFSRKGKTEPMLFHSGDYEILLLPVRRG